MRLSKWIVTVAILAMLLPALVMTVLAATPIAGCIEVTGNVQSEAPITATASGWWDSKTATVTIKNIGATKARITFTHSATGQVADFSLAGKPNPYELVLEAGETFNVSIKNKKVTLSSSSATLTLDNFTYAAIIEGPATVTHNEYGSVKVGGNSIANGGTTGTIGAVGAEFAATPASGATFVAWIDKNTNGILSTNATFTLKPYATSMKVEAVFTTASNTPYYMVGDTLFTDLNAAISTAQSGSKKTVVVISNGTLPADTFNIPNGVTLLVPYSLSDTTIGTETKTSGFSSTLQYANIDLVTQDNEGDNGQVINGVMEPHTAVSYTLTLGAPTAHGVCFEPLLGQLIPPAG